METHSATIKLFLPHGDAKSLRTAEIINWTLRAVAAPRTELESLLAREEMCRAGVYILIGNQPETDAPLAYIGESEVLKNRLQQHKDKEFWVSAIAFTSADGNLTKAHVRYLEARLIEETKRARRFKLDQNESSGSGLPESDRGDMEVFLSRIRQLLPVLGCDLLTPILSTQPAGPKQKIFLCKMKGAEGRGQRTQNGFVVFKGSTAVLRERPSSESYPYVQSRRRQLIEERKLIEKDGLLVFTEDIEFSSPSAAAAVIHGGSANGLTAWVTPDGKQLKAIDKQD